jgi:hypothetical protein
MDGALILAAFLFLAGVFYTTGYSVRDTSARMTEWEQGERLRAMQASYEKLSNRFRRLPAPWYGSEPALHPDGNPVWPDPDPDDPSHIPAYSPDDLPLAEEGPLEPLMDGWSTPGSDTPEDVAGESAGGSRLPATKATLALRADFRRLSPRVFGGAA